MLFGGSGLPLPPFRRRVEPAGKVFGTDSALKVPQGKPKNRGIGNVPVQGDLINDGNNAFQGLKLEVSFHESAQIIRSGAADTSGSIQPACQIKTMFRLAAAIPHVGKRVGPAWQTEGQQQNKDASEAEHKKGLRKETKGEKASLTDA